MKITYQIFMEKTALFEKNLAKKHKKVLRRESNKKAKQAWWACCWPLNLLHNSYSTHLSTLMFVKL